MKKYGCETTYCAYGRTLAPFADTTPASEITHAFAPKRLAEITAPRVSGTFAPIEGKTTIKIGNAIWYKV